MRKPIIFMCYAMILLLFVSACSKTEDATSDHTDAAVELGTEFIEKLYNVDGNDFDSDDENSIIETQNEFSSYLTKEEFEDLSVRRFLTLPRQVASEESMIISVEDIKFEQNEDDKTDDKKDSNDFNHSFTLILKNEKSEQMEELEIDGQMSVEDTEDGWKISKYYDTGITNELLNR